MMDKILIVEDEATWRDRLADHLRADEYEVFMAASVDEALRLLNQVKPDVLVLDMTLRDYGGYQGWTILDEIVMMLNSPEVIVLTARIDDPRQLREMRKDFGVFDIILKKNYQKYHFLQTVRDAVEAKRHADSKEYPVETHEEALVAADSDKSCPLTDSEKAVLREAARGKMDKEIAVNRAVSTNTIKAQLGSIYRKLGVSRRFEAIRAARKLGCIPGDDDDLM